MTRANAVDNIQMILNSPSGFKDFNVMGLKENEVSEWLEQFGEGLRYTLRCYGDTAGGFGIFDTINNIAQKQETDCCIIYDADNDFIAVTRGFISRDIQNARGQGARMGSNNTKPRYDFTGHEMAFLLGVEEAFHAYQYKHHKGRYPASAWRSGVDQSNIGSAFHYASNPIERDARQAVLQAARDMNLGCDPRYVRRANHRIFRLR